MIVLFSGDKEGECEGGGGLFVCGRGGGHVINRDGGDKGQWKIVHAAVNGIEACIGTV